MEITNSLMKNEIQIGSWNLNFCWKVTNGLWVIALLKELEDEKIEGQGNQITLSQGNRMSYKTSFQTS